MGVRASKDHPGILSESRNWFEFELTSPTNPCPIRMTKDRITVLSYYRYRRVHMHLCLLGVG
jgi:hypothetical protein